MTHLQTFLMCVAASFIGDIRDKSTRAALTCLFIVVYSMILYPAKP